MFVSDFLTDTREVLGGGQAVCGWCPMLRSVRFLNCRFVGSRSQLKRNWCGAMAAAQGSCGREKVGIGGWMMSVETICVLWWAGLKGMSAVISDWGDLVCRHSSDAIQRKKTSSLH